MTSEQFGWLMAATSSIAIIVLLLSSRRKSREEEHRARVRDAARSDETRLPSHIDSLAPAVSSVHSSDDFATSFAIGAATHDGLLGGVVGGDYAGGLLGAMATEPSPSYSAPDPATVCDSQTDYPSACDSSSSVDCSSPCDSGN